VNAVEISSAAAHKLIMMKEWSQLGQLWEHETALNISLYLLIHVPLVWQVKRHRERTKEREAWSGRLLPI